ncbi:hypothetical protein LCGC14_1553060, partial [marine sediment metagenome]
VILNFSYGPISTRTHILLSSLFNQTYLTQIEYSFYDYLTFYFDYSVNLLTPLFYENSKLLTSDGSSFNSIDFTRNTYLSSNNQLLGFNDSKLFINFEVFEDPYHELYVADIDSDGVPDYMQRIDADQDGEFEIIMYGVNGRGEILWHHRFITDEGESESSTISYADSEKSTDWFKIDTDQIWKLMKAEGLRWSSYTSVSFGSRVMNKITITETTSQIKTYTIIFDDDGDGYADRSIIYQRATEFKRSTVEVVEETFLIGFENIKNYHYQEAYIRQLTHDDIRNKDFSSITDSLAHSEIESGYVYYEDKSTMIKEDYSLVETLTYADWYLNEAGDLVVAQWREYKDNFEDNFVDIFTEFETYTITDSDTGEEYESQIPHFLTSPEDFTVPVWGADNAPKKFDSLIINTDGSQTITNVYEETIKINFVDRYNLFYDYLKTDLSDVNSDNTVFKVTGVFITPSDGKVYFTSDMLSFKWNKFWKAFGFTPAQIDGHYLFYDSNLDGSYETVFILASEADNNDGYRVVSIGFNYDADYSFIPYESIGLSKRTRDIIDSPEDRQGLHIRESNLIYPSDLPIFMDLMYPSDISGDLTPRDHILEVWRLIPPNADADHALLYKQVFNREYASAWAVYQDRKWDDIWDNVAMIVTAGTIAAGVSATGVGAPFAGIAFAATYYILTLLNQAEKDKLMKEQMKSRSFYRTGSTRYAPKIISEKRSDDFSDIWETWGGHPSAKYHTISAGELGVNQWLGEAVVVPPEEVRGESEGFDPFFTNSGLIGLNERNYFMVTSVDGYGSYDFGPVFFGNNRDYINWKYRTNSLGFLETKIAEMTRGDYAEFNRIKPMFINGRPVYTFVDGNDELHSKTFPKLLQPNYCEQRKICSDRSQRACYFFGC